MPCISICEQAPLPQTNSTPAVETSSNGKSVCTSCVSTVAGQHVHWPSDISHAIFDLLFDFITCAATNDDATFVVHCGRSACVHPFVSRHGLHACVDLGKSFNQAVVVNLHDLFLHVRSNLLPSPESIEGLCGHHQSEHKSCVRVATE